MSGVYLKIMQYRFKNLWRRVIHSIIRVHDFNLHRFYDLFERFVV